MGRMFDFYNRRSEETIWVDKGMFHMSVQIAPSSFEYIEERMVKGTGYFVQSVGKTIPSFSTKNQNSANITTGVTMNYYSLIKFEPANCSITRQQYYCHTEPSRAYVNVCISV